MKKTVLLFMLALVAPSPDSLAAEMGHKSHMAHGGTSGVKDERAELKLPDAMKVMQKKMMRKHLGTVAEIVELMSKDDLEAAAQLARETLGWTPAEEEQCSKVSGLSGEPDFLDFGMALHKQADAFADAAKLGDRQAALSELSGLILRCNDCHERFRH